MNAAQAEVSTAKLAKLQIGVGLLIEVLKGSGVARFEVTANALPSDATLEWVFIDPNSRSIFAVLKSESFAPIKEGDAIPELPVPICTTVR